jgi:hypothetical protein
MLFKRPIIPMHIQYDYIYTWRNSPGFPPPLAGSPLSPLCVPFYTYLAPSSCDRNRPPPSQVACKLTPFAPPFTQLTHPLQIPRTPTAPRLKMTTSGIFRRLLSGTGQNYPCPRFRVSIDDGWATACRLSWQFFALGYGGF